MKWISLIIIFEVEVELEHTLWHKSDILIALIINILCEIMLIE